jgi:hypothetical protein
MPVRRLNFTGRKRISKEHVELVVQTRDGYHELHVGFDLSDYGFPSTATVHLEAFKRARLQRFDYGSLSSFIAPSDMKLTSFSSPEGLKFRLKVVDGDKYKGRILGESDNLHAVNAEAANGTEEALLPVEPSHELGSEVFRLDFSSDEAHLLVNADLVDWRAVVRDPVFVCLVYPNILRQVLFHIVHVEGYRYYDEPTDWKSQWLVYTRDLLKARPAPENDELDDVSMWVDDCVSAFCAKHRILGSYSKCWGGF